MGSPPLSGGLFLIGLPPGDALVFPSFDDF
jgi:hypothetical protein